MLALILIEIAATVLLFRADLFSDREAQQLTLFAVAGSLGGALRTFAYSLAFASFTDRERAQWSAEAVIAPIIGAVAGLISYLAVSATLVETSAEINRQGQFLVSLIAGAVALRALGPLVERGMLRSGLSRTGILGGEVSPSVPVLDRIETVLAQRLTESTLANYDGWLTIEPRWISEGTWAVDVRFSSSGDTHTSSGLVEQVQVLGGTDRDAVLFGLASVSQGFAASPPLLSISAPRVGKSAPSTIFLEEDPEDLSASAPPVARTVTLEVGQGTKTLKAIRIDLPEDTSK